METLITTAAADEQIDLALIKREAARNYVRRRHALRTAVRLGLPAEMVREVKRQIADCRTTWIMVRKELKLS